MLHQFTFKNYRSFKNEVTLDLLATAIKEHPNDVVTDVMDEKVLKVAAIYGANASGKSNVISAFNVMKRLVIGSFRQGINTKVRVEPYWFEEEEVPTQFSVLFSINQDIFQYGFSISKDTIIEEYLYMRDRSLKKEAYSELFSRVGEKISGELVEHLEVSNILELIESDTLIVSVLSKLKIDYIRTVYEWFRTVRIVDYGNPTREMSSFHRLRGGMFHTPLILLLEDELEKKQIEKFIKAIDVGISKLGVIEENEIIGDEELNNKRIVSYHRNPNTDELVATPIINESSGTLKMLMLYVDIKNILDGGGTLFVDELDAKLHPLLIRYIIIMFHDKKLNPKNAQLIFSTQEVFTLDKENLRRDEIWFTDKNRTGESDLYSLVSYIDDDDKKIRNDASYGKDYILGKYKSIPSLKRMEDIDG